MMCGCWARRASGLGRGVVFGLEARSLMMLGRRWEVDVMLVDGMLGGCQREGRGRVCGVRWGVLHLVGLRRRVVVGRGRMAAARKAGGQRCRPIRDDRAAHSDRQRLMVRFRCCE